MAPPLRLRRAARLLAAFAALALVLAPAFADARPGGGVSSGSRGMRSYSPPPRTSTAPSQARPLDRTMSQPSTPGGTQGTAAPGTAAPGAGAMRPGGFFGSGLMGGIAGGLLGAGLFGMLSGAGFMGGIGGLGGMLGLLLQIGLIVLVVSFLLRRFRPEAGRPAMAGGPGLPPRVGSARMMDPGTLRAIPGGGGGMAGGAAITLAPTDFEAFQRLLVEVNAAWSRQDLASLRRIATPEMAEYFGNDLRDLAARGWRNETRDVVLEKGDLAEAWAEGRQDYATVAMRFSLVDVTTRQADGAVVEGDPAARQTTTELWTFVREDDGPWRLSAIQQIG